MAATVLPVNYDLRIYRGDDYFVGFFYDEVDQESGSSNITDASTWAALLQIRTHPGGAEWLALSTEINLSLGESGGLEIAVRIPASTTSEEVWASRAQGTWDIQLTDGQGIVTTPFAGRVYITQDISRAGAAPA